MLYEMDAARIHRHAGPSSHAQSYRIAGGNAALVHALRERLPETSLHEQTRVCAIRREGLEIEAEREGHAVRYTAEHAILALPPRLLNETVLLAPAPAEATREAWRNLPTWMAGHCKMVFVYGEPFWRAQGLSGDVFSRPGPMSEIYDGSPADESFHALTAFVGLGAARRRELSSEALHAACMAQLERLFGPAARDVREVLVSDWSSKPSTTSPVVSVLTTTLTITSCASPELAIPRLTGISSSCAWA